jgi:hypothetical protein
MELGELGDVSVADNITVYFAPSFLAKDDLAFLPIIHAHLIQLGRIITYKNELIPTALCEGHNNRHFELALHTNGCFLQ